MEGLVVVGMSILLVSGNFDLSVGSVMALAGIVTAWMMVKAGAAQLWRFSAGWASVVWPDR